MKFCQFTSPNDSVTKVGVHCGTDHIATVERFTRKHYGSMVAFIQEIQEGGIDLALLESKVKALSADDLQGPAVWPADKVHLLAPVTEPPKFFAIAINGRANWERSIKPENAKAQYFIKLRTCITGPYDPIEIPDIGSVGPEVELALVIGKKGRHIKAADAYEYIFGYTCHNDLTAHDLRAKSEWIKLKRKDGSEEHLTYPGRWKNFDTFSPMGPYLVTRDEVPDPHVLEMSATLNEHLVQQGSTSECVYRVPEIIEYLSAAHTLEVGDIISLGTVPAVAPWTMAGMDLRRYGGTIEARVEGVGTLRNPIRAV